MNIVHLTQNSLHFVMKTILPFYFLPTSTVCQAIMFYIGQDNESHVYCVRMYTVPLRTWLPRTIRYAGLVYCVRMYTVPLRT